VKTCSICSHADRDAIEASLVRRESPTAVAARHGVSRRALFRHTSKHLPQSLAAAQGAADVARGDDLLAQLRALGVETREILDRAKVNDDDRALRALARLEKQIELVGRLRGELQEGTTINNVGGDLVQVAALMRDALAPWPDAQLAVADAIRKLGPAS
jgi:hypothetical protein